MGGLDLGYTLLAAVLSMIFYGLSKLPWRRWISWRNIRALKAVFMDLGAEGPVVAYNVDHNQRRIAFTSWEPFRNLQTGRVPGGFLPISTPAGSRVLVGRTCTFDYSRRVSAMTSIIVGLTGMARWKVPGEVWSEAENALFRREEMLYVPPAILTGKLSGMMESRIASLTRYCASENELWEELRSSLGEMLVCRAIARSSKKPS